MDSLSKHVYSILGRFQDAAPHTPFGATSYSSEFPADEDPFDLTGSHRPAYRGRSVPGA